MRISQISLRLTVEDINSILHDALPDAQLRVTEIVPGTIRGQVRFLFWNIDFVAQPAVGPDSQVSIDVSAHKMVPIPAAIVGRQLREAIKDAPPGVDVIQQSLRVRLPDLLRPFGVQIAITTFHAVDNAIEICVENVSIPELQALLKPKQL